MWISFQFQTIVIKMLHAILVKRVCVNLVCRRLMRRRMSTYLSVQGAVSSVYDLMICALCHFKFYNLILFCRKIWNLEIFLVAQDKFFKMKPS